MDPRPYNYEFRRPRFNNPTLYHHSYDVANPTISTKVSITSDPMARILHPSSPTATKPGTPLSMNIAKKPKKIIILKKRKFNIRQFQNTNIRINRKLGSIHRIRGRKGIIFHHLVPKTVCQTMGIE